MIIRSRLNAANGVRADTDTAAARASRGGLKASLPDGEDRVAHPHQALAVHRGVDSEQGAGPVRGKTPHAGDTIKLIDLSSANRNDYLRTD